MTTEFSQESFTQLGLHPQLVQTVAERGYETPTPVQATTIPLLLAGQDVIGQAQTGTGKTAAFALPVLQNLQTDQPQVQCLIVAPTRELALQVAEATEAYGSAFRVRVLAVYGGQPYGGQIRALKRGVQVVVGTPGRLLDLLKRGVLDLTAVSTVVLDEADEMLSMGFIEDIEALLDATPAARQTALFSATMPAEIRRLANRYMRTPQSVTVQREELAVGAIEQRGYLVNPQDKTAALTRLFEVEEISRCLIFARTRQGTGELAAELTNRGFPAEALHGEMSQDSREQVLDRFRRDQCKVLVATDVAARGLDIDDISHVFNYDLPTDPEVYVHRVGRTGRAGKSGIAISLVTPDESWRMGRIERLIKREIQRVALPTAEEIAQQRETQLLERIDTWLRRDRCRREREIVAELVAQGHDPETVAAVCLKMARREEKQRPIDPISEVRQRKENRSSRKPGRRRERAGGGRSGGARQDDKNMVRVRLNVGRAQGVHVGEVVGSLADQADIPGKSLGKIRIENQRTLVDVPQQYVERVLAVGGEYRIRRSRVEIERE